MKRPDGNQLTILILSILVLIACLGTFYEFFLKPLNASLHKKAWAEDAERARQLCGYISQTIKTNENLLLEANYPTVFWDAGRNFARLEVFGITNFTSQEQIFVAAKEWQLTNQSLSKICVQFFEPGISPDQYGQRAKTLLREEFIVLTNARSGVIYNQAASKN